MKYILEDDTEPICKLFTTIVRLCLSAHRTTVSSQLRQGVVLYLSADHTSHLLQLVEDLIPHDPNISKMLAGGIYYATHRARASFSALLPAFLYQQFEHIVNYQYSGRDASSAKRRDFHFCRLYPGDDFATSLSRHEHYLCLKLKVKPGDTVLVVGCGTGDALFELVHYADVNVVGFDEDHEKVRLAEERLAARRAGLGNRTVRLVSG